MTQNVYIFDLDDTLVYYSKRGPVVPRQTFHKLRALHYSAMLMVVSYNPIACHVAAHLGLFKFCKYIVVGRETEFRHELVARALAKCNISTSPTSSMHHVYYFDDRLDNVDTVQQAFPSILCSHVKSPLLLYRDISRSSVYN